MTLDFALIREKLPEIAQGLSVTLGIWSAGLVLGILLGFAVALGRRYGPRPLSAALGAYVEIFRGTPFLIQLFLLYFGGPYAGLSLNAIPAGLLGLTIYAGAYYSEIFRGGFDAVPRGHVEAAECVGMSRVQIVRRVLLPEMAMLVLPASVNMAVILLKETAVMSVITVPELTATVGPIGSEYYAFVEAMFVLALVYWALVEICGAVGRWAEHRLARYRFAV